ncbi:BA75_04822T0 [Komagataella pastoris]|uniref:BA75_04822T0 n=1 Tax=Komagataella pastoris TaxID=4922 RepID=A0A1B2JHN3_PICPA|nr:BA75_04822T0 [Komagataella pastoris]
MTSEDLIVKRKPTRTVESSKLYSTGAFWDKVKSKASNTMNSAGSSLSGFVTTPVDDNSSSSDVEEPHMVREFGPLGELLLLHNRNLQLWDWVPTDRMDQSTPGGTLYLIASLELPDDPMMVKLISSNRISSVYQVLCCVDQGSNDLLITVYTIGNEIESQDILSGVFPNDTKVYYKGGKESNYFSISTGKGKTVIVNKSTFAVEFEFNARVINNMPVVDVCGSWLAYNASPDDLICKGVAVPSVDGDEETQEKLLPKQYRVPRPRTLLQRVLSNMSTTAMDSIFKLTELSSKKVKQMLDPDQRNKVEKSNNIKNTITKLLNTLNGISQSHYIVLVCLITMEPKLVFLVPGGCSHVSISPYDMLLTSTTIRGDDILIWDFTRLSNEIVLVDKLRRGNTPGIISRVLWGAATKGIGVLSRNNGSIIWFGIRFDGLGIVHDRNTSWVLSCTAMRDMEFGPSIILASAKDTKWKDDCISLQRKLSPDSCLMCIDKNLNLQILSLSHKSINWKFNLPQRTFSKLLPSHENEEIGRRKALLEETSHVPSLDDPLSQAEIETCIPYPSLHQNRHVKLKVLQDPNMSVEYFLDSLRHVGSSLQTNTVTFGRPSGNAVLTEESATFFKEAMSEEIVDLSKFMNDSKLSTDVYHDEDSNIDDFQVLNI